MLRKFGIGLCLVFPTLLVGGIARYALTGVDSFPDPSGMRWICVILLVVASAPAAVAIWTGLE